MLKRKLLFFGENPNYVIHGISLSSSIILKILSEIYCVHVCSESRSLVNKKRTKILMTFLDLVSFARKLKTCRPNVFYTILPTSNLGALKVVSLCFLAAFYSRKIRIFLHIHRGDFVYQYKQSYLFKRCISYFNRNNCIFICLSESQEKSYRLLGLKNVHALHNTVVLPEILNSRIQATDVVCVANYLPGKGIEVLLSAMKFPNMLSEKPSLSVYGYGNPSKYEEYIQMNRLKNVTFAGPLEYNDKASVLSNSKVLVLASLNEGAPLVILEAMKLGTIIVATEVGLVKEMLGEEYPFTCVPDNAMQLAKCLSLALNLTRVESNAWGRYLRDRFERLYGNDRHYQRVMEIFTVNF